MKTKGKEAKRGALKVLVILIAMIAGLLISTKFDEWLEKLRKRFKR